KVGRKGVQLLGGFHQPLEDGVRIDLEHPRCAPDAQTCGQTRHDAHDELRRGGLAMKHHAVGLIEVSVARDTLQLAPGLAAGMAMSTKVAASEPAVVGAIRIRKAVSLGVDNALASSGAGQERRWRAGGLGTRIGTLLTSFT